jgi:hypothetical protein
MWLINHMKLNFSVASNASESRRKVNKRKRKRTDDASRDVSDAEDSDNESTPNEPGDNFRSRLAKRILTANSRKSQLSKSVVLGSKPSSASASPNGSSHRPSPGDAPSANGSAVDKDSGGEEDVEDSDLDDWANEFEKDLV